MAIDSLKPMSTDPLKPLASEAPGPFSPIDCGSTKRDVLSRNGGALRRPQDYGG
jgi:hypothetical protein